MARSRKVMIAAPATIIIAVVAAVYWWLHRGPVISAAAPIPTCTDTQLPPEVEALVRPVLEARHSDDWHFEYAALEELLSSTQAAAFEARIALMAYYLGAHPGEELLESVLAERQRATPLVRRYSQCRPSLRSERRMRTVRVSRTKYDTYLQIAEPAG